MTKSRQALGRWGEALAASFLTDLGYSILECNVRTSYGEIDLVACQEGAEGSQSPSEVLVFVEVKTRTSIAYGHPEESITSRKRAHLLAAAQAYLLDHPEFDGDWRVDVIAIQRTHPGHPPTITHFENAIT